MAFLYTIRFTKNGPTNTNVKNAGGVTFNSSSAVKNGITSAYFNPGDDNSYLFFSNGSLSYGANSEFTIYFKFKINKDYNDNDIIPIITTGSSSRAYLESPMIYIKNKSHFVFHMNDKSSFTSTEIADYILNDQWHTFCITRSSNVLRVFVDGYATTKNKISDAMTIYDTIYIGRYNKSDAGVNYRLVGQLDDICFLNNAVYTSDFIPPSMYFNGSDTRENYFRYNKSNTENIPQIIQDTVEKKMLSTTYHINERQKGWLPRRLRIKWAERRGYFKNTNFNIVNKRAGCTVLSLYGLENPYQTDSLEFRFFEGNAYRLWQQNRIWPFMMFINGKFIKLSDIDMAKSDQWFTVFIKNRDPKKNPRVHSVEIVILPFPVIYEEGLGERSDMNPLYVFNQEGYFNISNGYTFYYLDKNKAPQSLHSLTIREQFIPSLTEDKADGSDVYDDSMFMHNIWRYGTFTADSIESDGSAVCTFHVNGGNTRQINSADEIILYKNTTFISPKRYRIVGTDKIQFYDYENENIPDNTFTMQIVTDNRDWEIDPDLTTMRVVDSVATIDNQSVFSIPQVTDADGLPYRHFLVFRGSVCMDNQDRYYINDDYTELTLTESDDWVPKGDSITFIFIKLTKADQYGPLHVKPMYLYTTTNAANTYSPDIDKVYRVPIPELNGLVYNKNNVMMFYQDTFVFPDRYIINERQEIELTTTRDYFMDKRSVVFVLLKMANRFEDPLDDHDRVIKEETEKGRRFVLYDLGIDKSRVITIDNFVCFDNQGKYIPDLFGEVYNRNVIKFIQTSKPLEIVPRYLTCMYSDDSLDNESNAVIPTNDDYIKEYILLRYKFYELDPHFQEFMSDFDVRYTKDIHYGENLARALDYMVCYNQNKLDEAFESTAVVKRYKFNTVQFNKNLKQNSDGTYYVTMQREAYKDNYSRAFPVFFLNGIVPTWYQYTQYSGNEVTIKLPTKLYSTDSLEVLWFKDMVNYFTSLKAKYTTASLTTGITSNIRPMTFRAYEENALFSTGFTGTCIFAKAVLRYTIPGTVILTDPLFSYENDILEGEVNLKRFNRGFNLLNGYLIMNQVVDTSFDQELLKGFVYLKPLKKDK